LETDRKKQDRKKKPPLHTRRRKGCSFIAVCFALPPPLRRADKGGNDLDQTASRRSREA
jgi:hypothetical protein